MDPINAARSGSSDGLELFPSLVLAFKDQGRGATEQRRIPPEGFLLGLGAAVFADPFGDERMAVRHAEVRLEAGGAFVRDLASAGGTRLNGEALSGKRALAAGDVLRLGDTLFVYAPAAARTLDEPESELIGESAGLVAVRRSIEAVAAHKHTVVVTGETGTGKEVVARMLHQRSGRPGPYLAVNCGAFAEGLLPSDLFGHVRGAFTGAVAEQQGLFRAARGGTLLLDEVAEISIGLQANLLRVLEMREVRPVGSTKDFAVDVRVVATSNRELMALVQERVFRSDLYSRLAQWTIRLPPLRERRDDIPSLTHNLLGRCDAPGRALTVELAEALLLHDWPLNVRGLFNVLSIASICAPGGQALSLGGEVRAALWTSRTLDVAPAAKTALVTDKDGLEQLLERFHGGVAAAARHLGITRPKLYRLLQTRGVVPAAFRHRGQLCPAD
jgi:DNA-binding NtrC family response regulator